MSLTPPVSPFNGSSEDESYSTQTESEQENDTENELAGHAWQFSSLEVARMLSPKKPKPGVEVVGRLLPLDQYDCVADGLLFQETLDDVITHLKNDNEPTSQSLDRHGLATFLTRCITACRDALDKQQCAPPPQDRWYKDVDLTLTGVRATAGEPVPFKSGIAYGQGLSQLRGKALPLEDKSPHRIMLLVEAEGSWKETISQASDSARHLFGASQVRSFVLVLAFNWDSKALRFLIFHHGGVTASEPCNIAEFGGLKEAVRMLLALAFWSTPVGTGFIPSCTNTEYALPADCLGKSYKLAAVDDVLSRSPCVRGRMTLVSRVHLLRNPPTDVDRPSVNLPGAQHPKVIYIQPNKIFRSENDPPLSDMAGPVVVKTSWQGIDRRGNEARMYSASSGHFGTIPHVCSYEGMGEHHEVISNILFLPRQKYIGKHHWSILHESPPTNADLRTLWVTVFGIEGQSLVQANSPRQLSRAWVHSILGWLSTYLSGYLHRDPSIGNILMTSKPVKRKAFEVPAEFWDNLRLMEDQELTGQIRVLCGQVEALVKKLGISNECTGFITNGDLAIPWNECFSEEPQGKKSGTLEFVSRAVVREAEMGLRYIHSPTDDLESFFWVALWSVLFSEAHKGSLSPQESHIRAALTSADKDRAAAYLGSVRGDVSDIMKCFFPVLSAWQSKVMQQSDEWGKVLRGAPKDAGAGYYLPRFHCSALQGVVDILEVISERWNGEVGWDNWTGPA